MPYKEMPWVREDRLCLPDRPDILVDSQDWFDWLRQSDAFCYQPPGSSDRVTLRREKRRRQFYWYAYLKSDRKLHNAYAGKTERLTASHLRQVCALLSAKARQYRAAAGKG